VPLATPLQLDTLRADLKKLRPLVARREAAREGCLSERVEKEDGSYVPWGNLATPPPESTNEVLRSAAGYYIGTQCECGPYSRESGYYRTYEEAESALNSGSFFRL
jgi:hypothetical protein